MKQTGLLLVLSAMVLSCAKERPAEKVFVEYPELQKEQSFIKNFCTVEDKCLYVPSVANTPYNVTASRPFWQGEAKLVVSEIQEDGLVLKEIDSDDRFQDNINNRSPVLKLDVKHVDYKCIEDAYGDCTNKEEVDTEKHWSKRRYVQFDKNGLNVQESNSLPIEFGELFRTGCFSEIDRTTTKFDIEEKAINIGIRKTYKAQARCIELREIADLRYLNFTVEYHYSIVKLSALADSNYTEINYPKEDKNTFGFFTTEKKVKTVDNLDHVQGSRKILMNRWSPNKEEIVYYLNSDFYKKENDYILQATTDAVKSINFSLQQAKAKFSIKLENGEGKDPGDLRNNFLVLVNDPQASGVIGYGPSVANPVTGEIVKAQTIMYYGTIKKFISSTWDEIAEAANTTTQNLGEANADARRNSARTERKSNEFMRTLIDSSNHLVAQKADYVRRTENRDSNELLRFLQDNSQRIESTQESLYNKVERLLAQAEAKRNLIDRLSKETFYHASMFNFKSAVAKTAILDTSSKTAQAQERYPTWDELTEEQRESLFQVLLPKVWVPTLVHEFGHNLGLRHNFKGSVDKENYYSNTERTALGLESNVSYSSIMDYSHSNVNELSVFGKYDIAALKFAYARLVDVEGSGDASIQSNTRNELKVDTTLADLKNSLTQARMAIPVKLASYKYCTDEDVGQDPLCNRFDEGDDYEAVAKHYVDTYKENFDKRNFRNRRYEMNSLEGDLDYTVSILNSFSSMRIFFDQYDQMLLQSKLSKPSEESKKSLASLKKAADYVFNSFMEILEEPAYHCIKGRVDSNGAFKSVERIAPYETGFAGEANLPFDMRYGCQYLTSMSEDKSVVYYEFGKHFNNTLDFFTVDREAISETISQVDVRGFWIDKVLASHLLTYRMKSATTIGQNSSGNFLDIPEYKERFDKFMNGLLSNTFSKQVMAVSLMNRTQPVIGGTLKYSFDDSQVINKSYNWMVNGFFGLSKSRTNVKDIMLGFMKSNLAGSHYVGNLKRDDVQLQELSVRQVSTRGNISDYNFETVVEFMDKSCDISYRFGVQNYNTHGKNMADLLDKINFLEGLKSESLVKAFVTRLQGGDEASVELVKAENPCGLKSSIESLAQIDSETIEDFLEGRLNREALLNSFLALAI